MTLAEALAIVARDGSTDTYPEVTTQDVTDILSRHQRFGTRVDSTAYSIAERVVLSAANYNARVYECIEAGTTNAAESNIDWPEYRSAATGNIVEDGTVTWRDIGPAGDNYDVRGATKDVWLLKAGIAAQGVDHADGSTDTKHSQAHAHCLAMAARYEGLWVA